jgi:small-conductance mechanosensitive channel
MESILSMFDPDKLAAALAAFLPKLGGAAIVLLLFWVLQAVTRPALRGILLRANLHATLVRMIVDNIYGPVLLVLGIVTAAAHLGINVVAALAGIGVAGIAFGLAAQDSLANVIAGFLIFWDKPFLVGDYLTVMNQYGRVVEITMRSTRIRTQQNTYVVIPNKHIIDSVVVNHTKHGDIRVEVSIGIGYRESIPDARRVLLAAVSKIDGVLEKPAPDVVAEACAPSGVNLRVRAWINAPDRERQVFFRMTEASKVALDEAGIQIPYPHMQLILEDIEPRALEKAARLLAGQRGDGHGA